MTIIIMVVVVDVTLLTFIIFINPFEFHTRIPGTNLGSRLSFFRPIISVKSVSNVLERFIKRQSAIDAREVQKGASLDNYHNDANDKHAVGDGPVPMRIRWRW